VDNLCTEIPHVHCRWRETKAGDAGLNILQAVVQTGKNGKQLYHRLLPANPQAMHNANRCPLYHDILQQSLLSLLIFNYLVSSTIVCTVPSIRTCRISSFVTANIFILFSYTDHVSSWHCTPQ